MYFKPEFLNRFDSIIEFRSLEKEHLVKIVSLLLGELEETLAERGISLHVTDEAKEKIAELGYHPSFGARPLRRTIQEWVEDEMTDLLLDNSEITSFHVILEDDKIKVQAK